MPADAIDLFFFFFFSTSSSSFLSLSLSPTSLLHPNARNTKKKNTSTLYIQEELDRRLLVQLRDGRKLLGTLRSFDQFANLVLERTTERVVAVSSKLYADVPLGLYVVRGENVVLLGRLGDGIDRGGEDEAPPGLERAASAEAATASSTWRGNTSSRSWCSASSTCTSRVGVGIYMISMCRRRPLAAVSVNGSCYAGG